MRDTLLLVWTAGVYLLCTAVSSIAAPPPQKNVLLFYDTRSDMQSNVVVDQAMRSVLNSEFNMDLDIHSEYFEGTPVSKSDYPVLLSWLQRKYAGISFDVVVAVGQNSLAFVREYERDLFPAARVVFWGRKMALDDWGGPPITGVVAPGLDTHIKGAFYFIHALQPELERLIVVSGAAEADRNWENAARLGLRPVQGPVTVTYLAGLSLEDLQSQLANLPKRSAILVLTMSKDGAGRQLIRSDVLKKIIQIASVPVYSTSAINLNSGIVGGALVNPEAMALDAAVLVTRILRGENLQEMPVQESPLTLMVNWKVLNRWNIPENRVPPGTVVMYKEASLWTQYKGRIIAFLSLCTIEGVLIVALLVHRNKRRRAEQAMRQSKRLLQATIDAVDARLALLDEDGMVIAVNEPWRSFAKANGYDDIDSDPGQSYLKLCESSAADEQRVVSRGLRGLLSGELADFCCVYPSVHEQETTWFQVRIKRFHIDGALRFVVAHENVTEIKEAHDSQQQLTSLLMRAQDDARRRISRDLHDVTVQDLAAIRADLDRIDRAAWIANHSVQETLDETLLICDRAIKDLRTLSYLLHPPLLDEAGLIPALQWFVRGFVQRSGVQVQLLVMDEIGRLGTDVETALFRVVQECLTNVHRHSGSRSAIIWVSKEGGTVRVQITDEGHGFSKPTSGDDQEAALLTGVGIMGMRQRLQQLGGDLEVESTSQGTTVNARIAIREGQDATYSLS